MTTLFISDIHLGSEHPEISPRFVEFIRQQAAQAQTLYILGDLFEVWIGDDGVQPEHQDAIDALRALTDGGVPVYLMHGNRDFLLGERFAEMTGCQLLTDPTIIQLGGVDTLLMHGDTLCTDDVAYQQFRAQVRNPLWQQQMLQLSVEQRLAKARHYRAKSQTLSRQKSEEIMDANQDTVLQTMRDHGVTRLIHGHTHRPAVHRLDIDGARGERIVLGAWYEQDSVLAFDGETYELRP